MSNHVQCSNYSRYFSLRQKVFLVNMSDERNCDIYESLSGVVVSSGTDAIELMIPCVGPGPYHYEAGKSTFKLISEAMGNGIQVLADVTGIVSGNIFQFRLHSSLEMFQRRIVPRVEFNTELFHRYGNYSLDHLHKEWKRVIQHLKNANKLPGLVLQTSDINLSAGGIGLLIEAGNRPPGISMFIVMLDQGPPVCALAETVWEMRTDLGLRCGFRFIQILKADQERINTFAADRLRESGGTIMDFKRNKVLVDKMG